MAEPKPAAAGVANKVDYEQRWSLQAQQRKPPLLGRE